jgi:hypothetical protein
VPSSTNGKKGNSKNISKSNSTTKSTGKGFAILKMILFKKLKYFKTRRNKINKIFKSRKHVLYERYSPMLVEYRYVCQ